MSILDLANVSWRDVKLKGEHEMTYRHGLSVLPDYNQDEVLQSLLILGGTDVNTHGPQTQMVGYGIKFVAGPDLVSSSSSTQASRITTSKTFEEEPHESQKTGKKKKAPKKK